jgi:hypothetical protein
MTGPLKEWNSVTDLAGHFGLLDDDGEPNAKAIYWMVHKGTAPRHYRIAGKLRFHRNDIAEWVAQQEVTPAPAGRQEDRHIARGNSIKERRARRAASQPVTEAS